MAYSPLPYGTWGRLENLMKEGHLTGGCFYNVTASCRSETVILWKAELLCAENPLSHTVIPWKSIKTRSCPNLKKHFIYPYVWDNYFWALAFYLQVK